MVIMGVMELGFGMVAAWWNAKDVEGCCFLDISVLKVFSRDGTRRKIAVPHESKPTLYKRDMAGFLPEH